MPLVPAPSPPRTASTFFLSAVLVLGAAPSSSCGRGNEEPSASAAVSSGTVVALVNGVPLTDLDVRVVSDERAAAAVHAAAPAGDVLATVVRDELARQQAVTLGLDADPDYQRELAEMRARLEAFQRERLAEMYYRREVARNARVDEAEARRCYEASGKRIRTELHVWQILVRDEERIEQVASELAEGKPFEDVARAQLPDVPAADRRPWDLGYLKWNEVPEAWRTVVDALAPGQTSGIIRGPNRRFWIVKLVDRRENPELTFTAVREPLLDILRNERLVEGRAEAERRLLESAHVEYP